MDEITQGKSKVWAVGRKEGEGVMGDGLKLGIERNPRYERICEN